MKPSLSDAIRLVSDFIIGEGRQTKVVSHSLLKSTIDYIYMFEINIIPSNFLPYRALHENETCTIIAGLLFFSALRFALM